MNAYPGPLALTVVPAQTPWGLTPVRASPGSTQLPAAPTVMNVLLGVLVMASGPAPTPWDLSLVPVTIIGLAPLVMLVLPVIMLPPIVLMSMSVPLGLLVSMEAYVPTPLVLTPVTALMLVILARPAPLT